MFNVISISYSAKRSGLAKIILLGQRNQVATKSHQLLPSTRAHSYQMYKKEKKKTGRIFSTKNVKMYYSSGESWRESASSSREAVFKGTEFTPAAKTGASKEEEVGYADATI